MRLRPESLARIRAWMAGAPVGDGGALARALVMANLAQPVPPAGVVRGQRRDPGPRPLDRPPARGARRLRRRDRGRRRVARRGFRPARSGDCAGALHTPRRPRRRRGGEKRGSRRGEARPRRAHRLRLRAPSRVARTGTGALRRPGRRRRSAEDRPAGAGRERAARARPARSRATRRSALRSIAGRTPARVVPGGRVPFVPGAALVVRRHLRFDETFDQGGEDVDLIRRANYVRYEPAAHVAHDHRVDPRKWLRRRVYYGRTAAPLAKRHPQHARPLHVSLWTTAAWAARRGPKAEDRTRDHRDRDRAARQRTAAEARASNSPRSGRSDPAGSWPTRSRARGGRRASLTAAAVPRARLPIAVAFAVELAGQPAQARRRSRVRIRRLARVPDPPHARPDHARPAVASRASQPLSNTDRTLGGRRTKWVVIALWLIAAVIAVPFQSKLQALASDESDAFQDDDAESVQVSDFIKQRLRGRRRDHRGASSTRRTRRSPSRSSSRSARTRSRSARSRRSRTSCA